MGVLYRVIGFPRVFKGDWEWLTLYLNISIGTNRVFTEVVVYFVIVISVRKVEQSGEDSSCYTEKKVGKRCSERVQVDAKVSRRGHIYK